MRATCMLLSLCFATSLVAIEPGPIKNVVLYKETDRFGGWPANGGIWNWGDEIVVGFTLGYHKDKTSGHTIDPAKPSVPMFARSTDGGEHWKIETPSYLSSDLREAKETACPGGIDFQHPDFALAMRMQGANKGFSRFYWSNDRCKTWHGPYSLPKFDRKGIFARTCYIVDGKHTLTAFITAAKEDGREGWPLCIRTTDGGKTWTQLSWIGLEPKPPGYAIMPAAVRLSPNELFTYIRCRGLAADGKKRAFWIEPYRSLDDGKTWSLEKENTIDNRGNPVSMIRLADGRVAMTYGMRGIPYGIRARLSSDGGKTWTKDIVLRDDGANWDLGYPRTVQRADGKVVTVYYFNDKNQKERYIAGTIWSP